MEVGGQLQAAPGLPPPSPERGKSKRCPLDGRLGEAQSRSGRCGAEKNLFPLSGIELRLLGRPGSYSDHNGQTW
jgi:hypothetical protein